MTDQRWTQRIARCAASLAVSLCVWSFVPLAFGQVAPAASVSSRLDGLIYIGVRTPAAPPRRSNHGGLFPARQIIAIDPNSGEQWVIVSEGTEPRVSPDGRQLAFQRTDIPPERTSDTKRRLCIVDLAKPGAVRVLCDAHWFGGWTGTGSNLSIKTIEGLYTESQMIDALTGERVKLSISEHHTVRDCCPVTDVFLAAPGGPVEDTTAWTFKADGSQVAPIAKYLFQARFSPDGQKIAFVRWEEPLTAFITDREGRPIRTLFVATKSRLPTKVCWSPDGRHLAIVVSILAARRDILAEGRDAVVIVNDSGRILKEFILPTDDTSAPDWR